MDTRGLVFKYSTGRKLTDEERAWRLAQNEPINVAPLYQLSVIRMNSTYLESVDKWFGSKGSLSFFMTAIMLVLVGGFVGLVHAGRTRPPGLGDPQTDAIVLGVTGIMMMPVAMLASWTLGKEMFGFTHYPMRFNRKNRMVYVFRTDGTVLSVAWDSIFFTLGRLPTWNEWEVRGHVLEDDNKTVRETFALSFVGSANPRYSAVRSGELPAHDFVLGHWEFIRRYMEDGPASISGQIQFCMPVDGRRETARGSFERTFANVAGAPPLIYLMLLPVSLASTIFRIISMRACRVPQWPQDVEEACSVVVEDPYAIAGATNAQRHAVFPESASAAGVQFHQTHHPH